MRETIFKKDFVFLRQVVLTKVFPPSASFRLTFCTYSRDQIPPPQTLQVTHYSSVKKRWRRSHAQLPASNTESYHLFNSEWNSTKNQQTQWQDCFFFLFSVRWESEAPLKSSSMWRRVVVSRTHCRLCPSAPSLPRCWYDRRGCRKDIKDALKTKRAPGSLIRHCWAAHSSYRKSSRLSISSQKKLSAFTADGTCRQETDIVLT